MLFYELIYVFILLTRAAIELYNHQLPHSMKTFNVEYVSNVRMVLFWFIEIDFIIYKSIKFINIDSIKFFLNITFHKRTTITMMVTIKKKQLNYWFNE